MKLFRISLLGESGSCVVRAENEDKARSLAANYKNAFETNNQWLDENLSVCTEVNVDGKPGLILKAR